jgi:Raf kinase inhibitor-like YbhB/YbcL family protein
MHSRPASARAVSLVAIAGLIGLLSTPGCWRTDALPAEDPRRLTIRLRSSAFADGEMIPKTFTCDGADRSPPLEWSGVPASARSLALLCDDPDAPMGTWSHWVVFNLSPEIRALKEGITAAETISVVVGSEQARTARQGHNDFDKIGYGGPCPPSGTHRYFFRLYVLDVGLKLGSTARRADVLKAIQGHILAEGRLMGKYQRSGKE